MADLEADPVFRIDDRCHLSTCARVPPSGRPVQTPRDYAHVAPAPCARRGTGSEQQRQRVMKKIAAMWRRFMQDGTDLERRFARLEIATLHDPAWCARCAAQGKEG